MAARSTLALDPAFVQRWSYRYAYESMLFNEVGPAVRQAGYFTKDQLIAVGRWKSTRRLGLVKALDGRTVVSKTRQALGKRTEDGDRHRVISELAGVGVPMASALLTVWNPGCFTVIDRRVLGDRSLNMTGALAAIGAISPGWPRSTTKRGKSCDYANPSHWVHLYWEYV